MDIKNFIYADKKTNQRIIKCLLTLETWSIITLLIVLILSNPTSGYELSIYHMYPILFWSALIASLFIGVAVILLEILIPTKNNFWILSIFLILTINFIFLIIPLTRGYQLFGDASGDVFSHIGWIKEIIQTGRIVENNFYPIIHLLISNPSQITGLPINALINYFPLYLWFLYPIFIFLFARILSIEKPIFLSIFLFSVPLIFSFFYHTIHPSFLSFIFIPLFLFLFYKISYHYGVKKINFEIMILVLCFLIVFFHPMTTLFLILIFIFIFVYQLLLKILLKFYIKNPNVDINKKDFNFNNILFIIIILSSSFILWYTSQNSGQYAIKMIYSSLTQGSQFTISAHYISAMNQANLSFLQTIYLSIMRYGAIILFIIFTMIFLIVLLKNILKKNLTPIRLLFGIQSLAGFLFAGLLIIANFIVSNPVRSIRFFILMSMIFIGLNFFYLIKNSSITLKSKKISNKNFKKILSIFILFSLFASIFLCIFNVYPSPITWQSNDQFTTMNYACSSWMVKNRQKKIQLSQDYGINIERMEHYINGVDKGKSNIQADVMITKSRFGYDSSNRSLIQVYNYTKTYLLTTENGIQAHKAFPNNVKKIATKFPSGSFITLYNDKNVLKIYDCIESKALLIK